MSNLGFHSITKLVRHLHVNDIFGNTQKLDITEMVPALKQVVVH